MDSPMHLVKPETAVIKYVVVGEGLRLAKDVNVWLEYDYRKVDAEPSTIHPVIVLLKNDDEIRVNTDGKIDLDDLPEFMVSSRYLSLHPIGDGEGGLQDAMATVAASAGQLVIELDPSDIQSVKFTFTVSKINVKGSVSREKFGPFLDQ